MIDRMKQDVHADDLEAATEQARGAVSPCRERNYAI